MKPVQLVLAAALAAAFASSAALADNTYVDARTVRAVQQTLSDRGFRAGGADGRMGARTQAALRAFQKSEHLDPTGRLNRQTLVALGIQKADDEVVAQELHYNRGVVRMVQRTLNNRGFRAGPPDGVLHERTRMALREFQRSENLEDTGRLNERTLAALGVHEPTATTGSSARR